MQHFLYYTLLRLVLVLNLISWLVWLPCMFACLPDVNIMVKSQLLPTIATLNLLHTAAPAQSLIRHCTIACSSLGLLGCLP